MYDWCGFWEKFILAFCGSVAACLMLFLLFLVCVIIPVSLNNEPTCFKHGYPKVSVTYDLEVYCKKRLAATDIMVNVKDLK